ncbi:MAG: hypothetical protein JWM43_586 [Acidobacteriaceae bacterium]|nr:hypothetical protein [Acidobacteriaceae bacterium]
MRHFLQLAAITLLTATTAHAQFHMPQLSHKEKDTREDVTWLALFANPAPNGRQNELIRDPRFKGFLRDHLTAPQTFWNDNEPLVDTILEFLEVPNQVVLDDNRYLSADGCVKAFCPARGLVFIDLGTAHPLVAFVAIDWVKENKTPDQSGAEYTLWLFSNRALNPGESEVEGNRIPPALKNAIARWSGQPSSGSVAIPHITNAVLVDPNGTPHQVSPATVGVPAFTQSKPAIATPSTPTSTQQPTTGSNQ